MSKIALRVSDHLHAQVKEYAEQHSIDIGEAADRLLTTAFGRIAALARYADQRSGKPAKKGKGKAKAKPKAAKAPKAPKAKAKRTRKPKAEEAPAEPQAQVEEQA